MQDVLGLLDVDLVGIIPGALEMKWRKKFFIQEKQIGESSILTCEWWWWWCGGFNEAFSNHLWTCFQ
jgi:hypothetical protein